jgi:hypothetical protein
MNFQVIYPVFSQINGDSMKEAVKNFVKLKELAEINNIIFRDQQQYYLVNQKRYIENQQKKIGMDIHLFPKYVANQFDQVLPIYNNFVPTFIPNSLNNPLLLNRIVAVPDNANKTSYSPRIQTVGSATLLNPVNQVVLTPRPIKITNLAFS